jgi:DNA-binding NarL/FixJ family response regulator
MGAPQRMNISRGGASPSPAREDRGLGRASSESARPPRRTPVFRHDEPDTAGHGRALRVQVVSAQPIVRAGIEALLETHADDVVIVGHRPALATPCASLDVVIYDVIGLHLDDGQDLEVLAQTCPGRVLALSRELQPGLAARALALGAVGAISIGADVAELLATVRAAASGSLHDGSVAGTVTRGARHRDLGRTARLTPREQDVLTLIVAGASNTEIADELFLSINTVKSFIRSAYAKIGATTRAQAAAWGVEHGFPTTRPGRPTYL